MFKVSRYGQFVNIGDSTSRIMGDPFLTPLQKSDTIRMLYGGASSSTNSLRGSITTNDIVRGAVGAGLGGVTAKYLGTVLGGVFGGLSKSTMNKVQNVGALAGMLRGSGIWK